MSKCAAGPALAIDSTVLRRVPASRVKPEKDGESLEKGVRVLLERPHAAVAKATVLVRYPFDAAVLEGEQRTLEEEVATLTAALPPPPQPAIVEVGEWVEHNWEGRGAWYGNYRVTAVHPPTEADGGTLTYDLAYPDGTPVLGVRAYTVCKSGEAPEAPRKPPALVRAESRLAVVTHLLSSGEDTYDLDVPRRVPEFAVGDAVVYDAGPCNCRPLGDPENFMDATVVRRVPRGTYDIEVVHRNQPASRVKPMKDGGALEVGARVRFDRGSSYSVVSATVLARRAFDASALESERRAVEVEIETLKAATPPPPTPIVVEVGATVEHNWASSGAWFRYNVTAVQPAAAGPEGGPGVPTYDLVYSDGSTVLGALPSSLRIDASTYLLPETSQPPAALVEAASRLAAVNNLLATAEDTYDLGVLTMCVEFHEIGARVPGQDQPVFFVPDQPDPGVQKRLRAAAEAGDVAAMETLLDDGADANDADALLAAIKACHDAAVALLIERGCFVNGWFLEWSFCPLREALRAHDATVADGGAEGALVRRVSIVIMLVAAGAETELERDLEGGRHCAVLDAIDWKSRNEQSHAGYNEGTAVLEALLAAGARADLYSAFHGTPLGVAACNGQADAVEVLVQHSQGDQGGGGRAILTAADATGKTALMKLCAECAAPTEQQARCCDLLLSATGMPVDAVDDDGNTALHHCIIADNGDFAEKLVKHGARTDITNMDGESPLDMARGMGRETLAERLAASVVTAPLPPRGVPSPPYTHCDPAVFIGRTLDFIEESEHGWSSTTQMRVAAYAPSHGGFRLEPTAAEAAGQTTRWVRHFDELVVGDAQSYGIGNWSYYDFNEKAVERYLQACKGLPFA